MRHEDRFVQSHRPYAVNLATLRRADVLTDRPVWWRVEAVWFRRRNGITIACVGELRTIQDPRPKDAIDFLIRYTDGRYGGDCHGRWDGENYWGAQQPDTIAEHLELLRPMLANHPAIPYGFDGWWSFR